jgi:hypothetical protein
MIDSSNGFINHVGADLCVRPVCPPYVDLCVRPMLTRVSALCPPFWGKEMQKAATLV